MTRLSAEFLKRVSLSILTNWGNDYDGIALSAEINFLPRSLGKGNTWGVRAVLISRCWCRGDVENGARSLFW